MRTRVSRIRRGGLALALAIGMTVTAAPLAAQADDPMRWEVSGSVYDIYGQSIQRFRVELTRASPSAYAGGDFNDGTFKFSGEIAGLTNGTYTLKIRPDGYDDPIEPGMEVVVHDASVTGVLAVVDLDEVPPPPVNAASVSLQGLPVVGQTLSVSGVPEYPGTPGVVSYDSAPVYLWSNDDGMIEGAHDSSYTLTSADIGHGIGVTIVTHPSAATPEIALRFGVMTHYLGLTAPVTSTFPFGAPTLKRTLNSVTLPKDEAVGLSYTLTVTGSSDGYGLSYAMGDAAGRIPKPALLARNTGVKASAVKRPTIGKLPIHSGANPAQVNLTPSTTPGRYRIELPVTQRLNGAAKATKTASSVLTLNANPAYSKAKTTVSRSLTKSGGYSVSVTAPAYQSGATVAVYDRLGNGKYKKVGTAKLKAKGGKAKATVTVSKRHAATGRHSYYVKVGSASYAPGYQTAKKGYTRR